MKLYNLNKIVGEDGIEIAKEKIPLRIFRSYVRESERVLSSIEEIVYNTQCTISLELRDQTNR